jgi:hypothetical protein
LLLFWTGILSGAAVSPSPDVSLEAPAPPAPRWLVSPLFDLLFVANVGWLVVLLSGWGATVVDAPPMEFWQIYFITTPHRWITLVLVATDDDRRAGRSRLFLGIAVFAAVVVLGVRQITGAFFCLAVIDVIWNAWHFASQHGGIVRMYARLGGGGRRRLENFAIRGLALYVILRLLGWTTGWTEESPNAAAAVRILDLVVLVPPAVLLALELFDRPARRLGKVFYLASVIGIYTSTLFAVRANASSMVLALTVAGAMFHAVEYLAIVTYYARRRRDQGSPAAFQTMARHWGRVLAFYILLLGALGVLLDGDSNRTWLGMNLKETWLGLNLWAAFLHYTYDGMIWKLRRPDTAKVLGVEVTGAAGKI